MHDADNHEPIYLDPNVEPGPCGSNGHNPHECYRTAPKED